MDAGALNLLAPSPPTNQWMAMSTLIRSLSVFALLVALVGITACKSEAPETAENAVETGPEVEVFDIDAAEAAELVAAGTVKVLDVRTQVEFDDAHIKDAVHVSIQEETFEEKVKELDHGKPYLVHCAAGVKGGRSWKAVDALKEAGATKVYHLNGGLGSWIQGNHPVEK